MSKIEFKKFIKKNTHLIDYVQSGTTTWQKLYELYDLYGENSNIWDKYTKNIETEKPKPSISNQSSLKDLFSLIKGVDLNAVQKGLNSLSKTIDTFKDFVPKDNKNISTDNYEPRPTYKYFED